MSYVVNRLVFVIATQCVYCEVGLGRSQHPPPPSAPTQISKFSPNTETDQLLFPVAHSKTVHFHHLTFF
jgi:hypothetical protein